MIHLVEPAPMDGSDPIDNYLGIRDELLQYDAPLAERPEVVAVTKAELPDAQAVCESLKKRIDRNVRIVQQLLGNDVIELERFHECLTHSIADR